MIMPVIAHPCYIFSALWSENGFVFGDFWGIKQLWQACRLYQRSVMMAPDHASLSLNLMHLSLHLATEYWSSITCWSPSTWTMINLSKILTIIMVLPAKRVQRFKKEFEDVWTIRTIFVWSYYHIWSLFDYAKAHLYLAPGWLASSGVGQALSGAETTTVRIISGSFRWQGMQGVPWKSNTRRITSLSCYENSVHWLWLLEWEQCPKRLERLGPWGLLYRFWALPQRIKQSPPINSQYLQICSINEDCMSMCKWDRMRQRNDPIDFCLLELDLTESN